MVISPFMQLKHGEPERVIGAAVKGTQGNQSALPLAVELLRDIDNVHLAMLAFSILPVIASFVIAAVQVWWICRRMERHGVAKSLCVLISIGPVGAVTSFLGMVFPRSAAFLYCCVTTYFALCLVVLLEILFVLTGGRQNLHLYLEAREKRVYLNVSPFCCCCGCLPAVNNSRRTLRICQVVVHRMVLLRLLLEIGNTVVFYETSNRTDRYFVVSNVFNVIGMFITFYFVSIISNAAKEIVQPYSFQKLFLVTEIAQMLEILQKSGFDVLLALGAIKDRDFLNAYGCAMFYMNFVLCIEMCAITVYMTFVLHPNNTKLYDKPHHDFFSGHIMEAGNSERQESYLEKFHSISREGEDSSSRNLSQQDTSSRKKGFFAWTQKLPGFRKG